MNSITYAPEQGSMIERTGNPIWNNLYEVRVPYVETLSAQFLKDVGMPTVGNRELDKQMHQDLVNVVISIDAIVEYYRRGVTVYVRNGQDTQEIYHIVNNYLLAWRLQVENGLNLGMVPMEDLMLLDRFAEMLYPVAQAYGAPPRTTSSLFANLAGGNGRFITRDSLFDKSAPPGEVVVGEKEAPKHKSVATDLTKAIAQLRDTWK